MVRYLTFHFSHFLTHPTHHRTMQNPYASDDKRGSTPVNPFRDRMSGAESQQYFYPPPAPPPAYSVPAGSSAYPHSPNNDMYHNGPEVTYSHAESPYMQPSPQHPPSGLYPSYGQGLRAPSPFAASNQHSGYGGPDQGNPVPPDRQRYSPSPNSLQPGQPGQPARSAGLLDRIKSSSSAPTDVLNPPPPSFSRAPGNNFPYSPFPPCVLHGIGETLDQGFPVVPPPSTVQPHPFATHDVKEEDWARILGDLKSVSSLSIGQKIGAGVAPMAMGVGFVGESQQRVHRSGVTILTSICRYIHHERHREGHEAQEGGRCGDSHRGMERCELSLSFD